MAWDVEEILSRLPLESRVRLLSGKDAWHTADLPDEGVRVVAMADGPHGLRRQEAARDQLGATGSVPATCFPTAAALASSWDAGLLTEVGAALGAEAAAEGVDVVLGPGLNIKRHPFGGRNFEYFSEDPLLSGRLAAAMVRGIRSTGTAACVKHFAVNNAETNRLVVDAVIDERTLREIYLTGFEIVIRESGPDAIMAAYNKVNGTYCCEHPSLLTRILRGEWGFTGLVMSDWGATNDRVAAVAAGMDLEMPGSGGVSDADVVDAVQSGRLTGDAVDACAGRVLQLAARRPADRPAVDHQRHHRLARRAAAQSTVLLANNGLLPLVDVGSVAVIGAFAARPRFQGAGSSLVNPTRVDTALAALESRPGLRVTYSPGYGAQTVGVDSGLITRAAQAAREADVAVVLVGLPGAQESEGFDRVDLHLPRQHDELVEAVCSANPNTVVALSNGSPVALPWADRPAAILECYLGGQAGGSALVDVLFGDEGPAGRLAESFPYAAADVPGDPWFPCDSRRAEYREGVFVGYRYYDTARVPVRYAFGHGLSYTDFEYGPLRLDPVETPDDQAQPGTDALVTATVSVTNTGTRPGHEVAQVYVHRVAGSHTDAAPPAGPEQELRGFDKVHLEPGESTDVAIPLGPRAFAHYDTAVCGWRITAGDYEIRVGSSSRDICAAAVVRLGESSAAGAEPGRPRCTVLPGGSAATAGQQQRPGADPGDLLARSDDAFARLLGHPIPQPRPERPFHRNSTIGDLRTTATGRLLRAGLRRLIAAPLARIAAGDDEMQRRLMSAADEAPLRQIVLFSNGLITWQALDAAIDWLNGEPRRAARGFAAVAQGQMWPAAVRRIRPRRH